MTKKRQEKDIACYVSWYPHLQDPNAPEPMQVYRYAAEVDALTVPVMIFMGENEQYQRKRGIEEAVKALRARNHPVTLVESPGLGRGFDFRSPPDAPAHLCRRPREQGRRPAGWPGSFTSTLILTKNPDSDQPVRRSTTAALARFRSPDRHN